MSLPAASKSIDIDGYSAEHELVLPSHGWLGQFAFFLCTVLPWGLVLALSWIIAHSNELFAAFPHYPPYSVARFSPSTNGSILAYIPSAVNATTIAYIPSAVNNTTNNTTIVPAALIPAEECPSFPPPSPPPPPPSAACECPSPFVYKYKDGVWSKAQYDSWLSQKPGDDPQQSSSYPYNTDYDMAVDAAHEAGGQLSITQVHVVVLTTVKYHRDRDDAVMASWGHHIPTGHIYMYTDGTDDEQRLPAIYFPHTPGRPNTSEQIPGSDPPQYTHPFAKYYSLEGGDSFPPYVRAMIRWLQGMQHAFPLVVADPNIRWLMFADGDTFVYWPHILRMCAEYNSSEMHSLANILQGTHIAGGAGWLISRAVVEAMVNRVHECYNYYWSACENLNCIFYDVQITRCFSDLLHIQHQQRFELEESRLPDFTAHPGPPHMPDLIYKRRNGKVRGATFHYTKGEDMVALHNVAMALGGR